jgi:iron complex outermembrane receptor protein
MIGRRLPAIYGQETSMTPRARAFALGSAVLFLLAGSATSVQGQQPSTELVETPLEKLLDIEVTSVAKRPQRVADSAAAIFVLTQDDIRRSGATTIPEALRLVPGLHVARVDSNVWVVNARGFSSRFSTKFLVLIDGRAVYTPAFSGVFWDVQDTALEDIDRIEVIRGPGAALWGVNAVNGVINIVTKQARDTQGGLLSVGAGNEERGFGSLRYGFRAGDLTFRAYAKGFNRHDARLSGPFARDAGDDWQIGRAGFRLDADVGARDSLTIQGDGYGGSVGETIAIPSLVAPFSSIGHFDQSLNGLDFIGRWQRTFSETSNLQLETYYDRTRRDDLRARLRLDTIDVDFQHRFQWSLARLGQNDLVWGLGHRFHRFNSAPGAFIRFIPAGEDLRLSSAFLSNDTTIIDQKLKVILGSKFERTTFTGFEWEPNARVLWTPDSNTSVWGAVSRAVRIPDLIERSGRVDIAVFPPGGPGGFVPFPTLLQYTSDSGFGSETLRAHEIGYRRRVSPQTSIDVTAFHNIYHGLAFSELLPPSLTLEPIPHLTIPVRGNNALDGETSGVETVLDVEPVKWWRLRASYSFLTVDTRQRPGGPGFGDPTLDEGTSPQHQGYVRSSVDIAGKIDLDFTPRAISSLRTLGVGNYVELDARLGWRPARRVELALVGRNLIHSTHQEFISPNGGPVPAEIQREGYGKITLRF